MFRVFNLFSCFVLFFCIFSFFFFFLLLLLHSARLQIKYVSFCSVSIVLVADPINSYKLFSALHMKCCP